MKNRELFNKIIDNFSKEIDNQLDKFFESAKEFVLTGENKTFYYVSHLSDPPYDNSGEARVFRNVYDFLDSTFYDLVTGEKYPSYMSGCGFFHESFDSKIFNIVMDDVDWETSGINTLAKENLDLDNVKDEDTIQDMIVDFFADTVYVEVYSLLENKIINLFGDLCNTPYEDLITMREVLEKRYGSNIFTHLKEDILTNKEKHELYRYLSHNLKYCDNQLTLTTKFFENDPDKDKKIKYIKEHGGYCDCEVIMNVCIVDLY